MRFAPEQGYALYLALTKRLKSLMPASLFGRALLILVLPTILLQLLAITIFYDRHWSSIQRHLSSSLAGEVSVVIDRAIHTPKDMRAEALKIYSETMNMDIRLLPLPLDTSTTDHQRYDLYVMELTKRLDMPFAVYQLGYREAIRTQIALNDQVIQIDVGIKRLESSTTYIFVVWVVSSSMLLTLIAILFLRNQIRPIKRLADAAERFGMGQDVSNFRPHGAEEVRKAGRAFITMRTRISRQISTRTAMLTGISHDLRTPLTRMKLQLAMLGDSDDLSAMQQDIQEMEYMLSEYLEFARGNDDSIPSEPIDVAEWLRDIIQPYTNTGAAVTYSLPESVMIEARSSQLKRAVENIITNALKYGRGCHVSLDIAGSWVGIAVEDYGAGVPEEAMQDIFRPFTRLEDSRNHETGGVGLGLAITRDIIQAHGGKIQMRNRYNQHGDITGLTVILMLPLPKSG